MLLKRGGGSQTPMPAVFWSMSLEHRNFLRAHDENDVMVMAVFKRLLPLLAAGDEILSLNSSEDIHWNPADADAVSVVPVFTGAECTGA